MQTEDLEAVHKLIKADTLDRLGLREVKNDLSKAEFVIQMLLLLDSVNERELTSWCQFPAHITFTNRTCTPRSTTLYSQSLPPSQISAVAGIMTE